MALFIKNNLIFVFNKCGTFQYISPDYDRSLTLMHFIDNRPVYRSRVCQRPSTIRCITTRSLEEIAPSASHTTKACALSRAAIPSVPTGNCPVCAAFYWASRPVRFFLAREISDEALFVRLNSTEVAKNSTRDFFEYPYGYHYYETDIGQDGPDNAAVVTLLYPGPCAKEPVFSTTFYQSVDGQLYFLHPKITRQRKLLPEFIYGTVKTIHSCKNSEYKHPGLRHVPPYLQIYIVVINE